MIDTLIRRIENSTPSTLIDIQKEVEQYAPFFDITDMSSTQSGLHFTRNRAIKTGHYLGAAVYLAFCIKAIPVTEIENPLVKWIRASRNNAAWSGWMLKTIAENSGDKRLNAFAVLGKILYDMMETGNDTRLDLPRTQGKTLFSDAFRHRLRAKDRGLTPEQRADINRAFANERYKRDMIQSALRKFFNQPIHEPF
jgi:hypothetical protein